MTAKKESGCPICKSVGKVMIPDIRDYFVFNGKSPAFGVLYCKNCSIAYTTPHLTNKELSKYYPSGYESFTKRKKFAAKIQDYKFKQDIKAIKALLEDVKHPSMFEIGAGRGEFLSKAKQNGFDVDGIEPGKDGVKLARQHFGLDIKQGYADKIKFRKKYDVVIAKHVFEHINDPLAVAKNICKNGLNKKGIFYIKVPQFDSWEHKFFRKYWHGFDAPRHRVHYTQKGIAKLLKKAGFREVNVKSEVVPNDIIRSCEYTVKHSSPKGKILLCKVFLWLPKPLQIIKAQALGYLMYSFRPGRLIAIARK
ncbi:class I SAM-dependent methyltransferase [Candidatus Woesearchaeota archaeon]|nr:class I SAM-dependent methyltransferase [Candidatus Woesearchaeota archaeon]